MRSDAQQRVGRRMFWREPQFWIVFVGSILITPVVIMGAFSGSRHALDRDAYWVFPFAMLLYESLKHLGPLGSVGVFGLLIGQLPLYGAIFGLTLVDRKFGRWLIFLLGVHVVAAIASLLVRR